MPFPAPTMIAFAVRTSGARPRAPAFRDEAAGRSTDRAGGGAERTTTTKGEGRHIAVAVERV
jgi:hypothetical protein